MKSDDDRTHSDIMRELLILGGHIVDVEKDLNVLHRHSLKTKGALLTEKVLDWNVVVNNLKREYLKILNQYEGVQNEKDSNPAPGDPGG